MFNKFSNKKGPHQDILEKNEAMINWSFQGETKGKEDTKAYSYAAYEEDPQGNPTLVKKVIIRDDSI